MRSPAKTGTGFMKLTLKSQKPSVVRHVVHSGAILRAGIGTRDGRWFDVGVMFERQVSGWPNWLQLFQRLANNQEPARIPTASAIRLGKRFRFQQTRHARDTGAEKTRL